MRYNTQKQKEYVTNKNYTLPAWRARVVVIFLLIGFLSLTVRAIYLQGVKDDYLKQQGEMRYIKEIETRNAHRGMILDRNGKILAISTPLESVWINAVEIKKNKNTEKTFAELSNTLGIKNNELLNKIKTNRKFILIKRQVLPEISEKIASMKLIGVGTIMEYKRYYPLAEVTAPIIGFTNKNDEGIEGLELGLQSELDGTFGISKITQDRRGRIIDSPIEIQKETPGKDVLLSIDNQIQNLAYETIKNTAIEHHAKAGAAVVLDSSTGEVLAIANWPSYNPNNRENITTKEMRNRAITDLFEPGSTIKPFTAASAIEEGNFTPETIINTENGVITISGKNIHDTHPEKSLTVSQVIQKSSNVGATKMALSMKPQIFWEYLNKFGFGQKTEGGFPGEAKGILRNWQKWYPIDQATMSYGNGISVNLLQLARAYTVFANDGRISPITFIKKEESEQTKYIRTLSQKTSSQIKTMLETVVQSGGTATTASVYGYKVAGKTGTAHKIENGKYVNKYVSSFVGMAPASRPRLIVAVMIDEPQGGSYYGGLVAGPAFNTIMSNSLMYLKIEPDQQITEHNTNSNLSIE